MNLTKSIKRIDTNYNVKTTIDSDEFIYHVETTTVGNITYTVFIKLQNGSRELTKKESKQVRKFIENSFSNIG